MLLQSPMRESTKMARQKSGSETYSAAIASAENYMNWVLDQFRPFLKGRILEVGVGHESYCALLRSYGDYLGIDVDEASIMAARLRFPDASFAVGDILDRRMLQEIVSEPIDTILSINVLEHIEDDSTAIAHLLSILKNGGYLLVSVPAMSLLYNDLDRLAGHYRRYSIGQMEGLLGACNAQI